MTFWLYGPWPLAIALHCNQLCETFLVCPQGTIQHHLVFSVSKLEYFEYCVSYSLWHSQIRFLDQKKSLLRFLNFPKFEYSFLYNSDTECILYVIRRSSATHMKACAYIVADHIQSWAAKGARLKLWRHSRARAEGVHAL